MQNGFIYELTNKFVLALNNLNLVQLFKLTAKRLTLPGTTKKELVANINVSIDVFIVLKWALIIFLWSNSITSPFWTLIIFYLLWSNLHTYFYYHLWKRDKNSGYKKMRRRFVSLTLAIFFSNISFAYLYSQVFPENFVWVLQSGNRNIQSLLYSFSQSFFVGSTVVYPKTEIGEILSVLQIVISFAFIGIILSSTLPAQNEKEI